MGQVLGFVATVMTVVVGVHYYLWRRLIRSTTAPGTVPRRVLTWALLTLAALLPVTMLGGRLFDSTLQHVVAWPGYLWLAVMFYLLVFSLVLEIPRAVAVLVVKRTAGHTLVGTAVTADEGAAVLVTSGISISGPSGRGASSIGSANAGAAGTGSMGIGSERVGSVDLAPDAAASSVAVAAEPALPTGSSGIDRRLFISRTAAAIAGVGALATVGYGVRTALGDPVIETVPIRLARLDPRMSGLRVAVVSDIHLGPLTGKNHAERIVRMINRLEADVVTIVGDLVDGTVAELGPLAAPLKSLESRYGTYFVTGNHEYYTANGPQEWIEELNTLGVRSLRNERVEIRHAGAVLDLAGVNDLAGKASGDGPDLRRALDGRDTERPVLLLAHQPLQVKEAAGFGVDLQLSGHTHGGQMAPFNLLVPLQQPVVVGLDMVLPDQSAEGARLSRGGPGAGGTQIYVTRGAGFWGPPVRVGAPPEITLLELRA